MRKECGDLLGDFLVKMRRLFIIDQKKIDENDHDQDPDIVHQDTTGLVHVHAIDDVIDALVHGKED